MVNLAKCAALLLVVTGLTALVPESEARNLHGRFGVGFNQQFSNERTGLGLKYGFTRDIAGEVIASIVSSDPINSATGVKFYKNLIFEQNLNFYATFGGGIVAYGGESGAEFLGAFGGEFFIPGIENLGFSFEAGLSFDNVTGTFLVKTLGHTFLNAGMHYYF